MEKEKWFDLFVVAFILLAGLLSAYVTFGVLESQAEAEVHKYRVSGAIAGALVSMSLLASVYLQVRKSSQAFKTLLQRNRDLEQKLIRGAPRPSGFEIEVGESQRIVLARPRHWEPRGGTIFDFEGSEDLLMKRDIFPVRFTCWFEPIEKPEGRRDRVRSHADTRRKTHATSKGKGKDPKKESYAAYQASAVDNPYIISHTAEVIYLGGDRSIDCLKLVTRQCVRIDEVKDPVTGRMFPSWTFISASERPSASAEIVSSRSHSERSAESNANTKNDVQKLQDVSEQDVATVPTVPTEESPSSTTDGQEPRGAKRKSHTHYADVLRIFVVCYHEDVGNIFYFDFIDDTRDFSKSSALFNQILSSVRFLI